MRGLWLCVFLFSFNLSAKQPNFTRGRLLAIQQNAQVYAQPRREARVLADIDEGMLFMLLHTARRGAWLLIEDEDGRRGWIERKVSDMDLRYQDPLDNLWTRPQAAEFGSQARPKVKKEAGVNPLALRHELALLWRDAYSGLASDYAWGARYYYFLPHNKPVPQNPIFLRKGLEFFYQGIQQSGANNGYNFGMRIKVLSRHIQSWFTLGADMGFHYQKRIQPDDDFWSGALGLHAGYFPLQPGISAMLRLGGEFFHEDRLSLELSVGYAF